MCDFKKSLIGTDWNWCCHKSYLKIEGGGRDKVTEREGESGSDGIDANVDLQTDWQPLVSS